MLAANGTMDDWGSGFSRNPAGGSRSNRTIDYRDSRPVTMNVFCYLPDELSALKWETNMHNIALGDRRRLIDIYAKGLIPALHDLEQRFANLSETNDNYCLIHCRKLNCSGSLGGS